MSITSITITITMWAIVSITSIITMNTVRTTIIIIRPTVRADTTKTVRAVRAANAGS